MRILFKITSRQRPQKFLITLKSIIDNLSEGSEPLILVSIDDDDPTKQEYIDGFNALDEENECPETIIQIGQSDNKVFAINRDMRFVDGIKWDILANVSDDQIFIKKDFDKDIVAAFEMSNDGVMTQYDLDRFIHFPDGYTGNKLASMSIMGRPYYQRFGYIYHPDYISLWCDNEAQDVAKKENKYTFVDKNIFRHEHPANTPMAKTDELLRYTQSFYHIDGQTYEKRQAAGFPIESVNPLDGML